jgi:hypothetical protein
MTGLLLGCVGFVEEITASHVIIKRGGQEYPGISALNNPPFAGKGPN